jgi:hypothetical protein
MYNSTDYTLVPYIKIEPHYIVLYRQPVWHTGRKYPRRARVVLPQSNNHNGIVSNQAASKIKKAINWLLVLAKDKEVSSSYHGRTFKFKLSFITLTLSSAQIHSDHEIKHTLLNQLLTEARKRWGVRHYLWRAESQKNGNIHFHIVCDRFIPWSELRDTWNRIQNKLGYVDRYREEMKAFHAGGFNVRQDLLKTWSYKNQVRAYRTGSKNDWNSPNSTDIHSIIRISNLAAYLSKYCTKNDNGRKIEGRLWGLSESLSQVNGCIEVLDTELEHEVTAIANDNNCYRAESSYYCVIMISWVILSKYHRSRLWALFRNHVYEIRNPSGVFT